jgi:osmotically-inducible protein OsmY
MDDKTLHQDIIDELDFDPSVHSSNNIGVAVQNGVVTLTGHVASYAEKLAAERAARRIAGVRAIAEEIEVRYVSEKKTADDQIAERALKVMAWDASVPEDAVSVRVEKGWVTLEGSVPWYYQKKACEEAVRKLTGVAGISNLIKLKPHVQAADVKDNIMAALKRSAEIEADAIRITVKDGAVTVDGKVKAWYERDLVEQAAWSAPGVTSVINKVRIG